MFRFFLLLFVASGIFSSQFYIFSSGLPQPSHMLLALFCFVFLIFCFRSHNNLFVSENKNAYKVLFGFVMHVAAVNLIYSLIHQNAAYNSFTVYLIYNVIIFCCMCGLLFRFPKAKTVLMVVIWVSILSLLMIWLLGLGRFRYSPRYNGFFNDPNQMAFWLLCLFSSYVFLADKNYLSKILLFGICAVLVIATMSRSALIGLTVIFCGVAVSFVQSEAGQSLNAKINRKFFGSIFSIIFALAVVYVATTIEGFSAIYERFISTDFAGQADIRGYGRVANYPEYLLFGAGQGEDFRFDSEHEIHSTWAGILFYYGLIGLFLFLTFIYILSRGLNLAQLAVFFGPLAYSASTFGARTPVFWFFLACAFYAAQLKTTQGKQGFPKHATRHRPACKAETTLNFQR